MRSFLKLCTTDLMFCMQGVCGGCVYSTADSALWSKEVDVREIPHSNIEVLEKLGEGQFGEVGYQHKYNDHKMTFLKYW